jgi:hypothetical protein
VRGWGEQTLVASLVPVPRFWGVAPGMGGGVPRTPPPSPTPSGFKVPGSWFRVSDFESRVYGSGRV